VDPKLYKIALRVELTKLTPTSDYFVEIIDSIISQQLSGKAAATIFGRFMNLFPK
jgi:3-methyladenine DNA glycosylase/8-oxoguanine DNA glycosylase